MTDNTTTKIIAVDDVNQALPLALEFMLEHGIREESRNGPVIVAPGIVITEYSKPWQRVLFSPLRDANPFFHLFESLWMLAGHNDIAWPQRFNSKFGQYSDDGVTQWGAYGYRWRKHFQLEVEDPPAGAAPFMCVDQLEVLVDELQRDPASRRAVLGMWDPGHDAVQLHQAGRKARDLPCNTHAYVDLRGGKLNLTVCCRSNDLLWGAYGANVVHFSFLQEYLACRLGVLMGEYRQVSNNFHLYTNVFSLEAAADLIDDAWKNSYRTAMPENWNGVTLIGLLESNTDFMHCLEEFLANPLRHDHWNSQFLQRVARPMYVAWKWWKLKNLKEARSACYEIMATDWRVACTCWLQRRADRGIFDTKKEQM